MRVLLVSTYELGHQPLHLASPAARLLAEGHQVQCLDLAVEDWDWDRFDWADRVAFSVPMHTAMRLAIEAVARLRARREDLPVAFYGLYAGIGARGGERRIVGEYEDGLAAWAGGEGEASGTVVDLGKKDFYLPARQLLPPLDRYARLRVGASEMLAGYVEASHGCRHRCHHCPLPAVYDGRYRVTGLETVLADAAQLVAMGAGHLSFGDPDFLNAPRYAVEVLREVSSAFPRLSFDLTVKVEHILEHPQIWGELAGLGVIFVVSAFETTNDRILRILDKGHSASGMSRAVGLLRDAGIAVRPSWMPFTPWTGPGDPAEILRFLVDHDLVESIDPIQLAIRLLLPEGSLLLQDPLTRAAVDGYDPVALTYTWRSPYPHLDRLQADLSREAERGGGDRPGAMAAIWDLIRPGVAMPSSRRVVPHLTEAWFCCAEPTSRQLSAVGIAGP